MKFKEYIKENISEDNEWCANYIMTHCKPYLAEIKSDNSYILYRGMNQIIGNDGLVVKTRAMRKPSDTKAAMHMLLDEYFAKYYNHKWRSNHVMFATPNIREASEYGIGACAVFPIGEFKYLWSGTIRDLYYTTTTMKKDFTEKMREIMLQNIDAIYPEEIEYGVKFINDWFEKHHVMYQDTHLTQNDDKEVMVNCKSYFAIDAKQANAVVGLIKDWTK